MRNCGECTLCCYFMNVPQLASPANEYCTYCKPGEGCSVWNEREEVCETFGCLWWLQEQIPEYLRPDRIHVMFELPALCHVVIGYVEPGCPDAWKQSRVLTMIHKINQAGHPVALFQGKGKQNMYFVIEGYTKDRIFNEIVRAYHRQRELHG